MADANSLREAIAEYECQLAQVVKTLTTATEGSRRGELLCLKSNIQELIELTKESLQKLEGITINIADKLEYSSNCEDVENVENVGNVDDPLAQEYALFKAALEGNSDESKKIQQMDDNTTGECYEVEDELKQLEGTRCRARYESTWEGGGYHNAMICSVYRSSPLEDKSLHNVKVRVLFTNPTQKEMLPCQYYLNGRCKFSEKCRFSHGEVVLLSNLQEYREPNFLNIKTGSRVLTKQKDELWHRSIVLKTPEENEDVFRVKLEAKGDVVEVNVQDLVPLDDTGSEASDMSDNDDNNDSDEPEIIAELIHKSLLTPQPNGPLGEWEKHTRGIGSKLMAQMGYVHGTGLGRKADGRIEPVEAVILPPGKSLDHCMELRELATDGKNLMTVERNLRKKKFRQKRKQKYRENQQAKRKEEGNVFNFLNTTLGNKDIMDQDKSLASTSRNNDLKNASIKNLNVANFKIGEDIMKLEKESSKLKNLMGRQVKGSITYNNIASRYNEKQKELENLRAREKNIVAEQSQRKNKRKLSIF